jgi:hypothetical protein
MLTSGRAARLRECLASGHALVDLGRDDPLVREDLAVLAVEGHLHNPPSVTITYRHAPPTRRSISASVVSPRFSAPPTLDQLGRAPRLVHQVLGHQRLGQPEQAYQVVHRALPTGEDV